MQQPNKAFKEPLKEHASNYHKKASLNDLDLYIFVSLQELISRFLAKHPELCQVLFELSMIEIIKP
jgi:hypothetical protein